MTAAAEPLVWGDAVVVSIPSVSDPGVTHHVTCVAKPGQPVSTLCDCPAHFYSPRRWRGDCRPSKRALAKLVGAGLAVDRDGVLVRADPTDIPDPAAHAIDAWCGHLT